MVYRVLTGLACLSLAGCFSEPPSTGGGGGSTSGGVGSTSSGAGSTSSGTTSTGSSSGESSSSTDPGSSSSGTLLLCEDEPVVTGMVPADVVIIVGEGSTLPKGALEAFTMETNVAVLAPASVATGLETAFTPECRSGCQGCAAPNRVLVPYAEGEAFDAFLGDAFECVFRGPPPGSSLSEPSRHVWLFTQDPALDVPPMVRAKVIEEELRLHVACPDCDEEPPTLKSQLGQLVAQTRGTVADSTGDLGDQSEELRARRTSCIWEEEDFPLFLEIINPLVDDGFVTNNDETAAEPCEEVIENEEGVDELYPLYFENNNGDAQLCPFACRMAQLPRAEETEIFRCD